MTAVAQIIEEMNAAPSDRNGDQPPPPMPKAGARRDDNDYLIMALADGLEVLEALKGQAYEPVSIREVERRSGRTYDFCRRALKTLKVTGWAVEDDRGWRLSVKAMQFSDQFLKWAAALAQTPSPDSDGQNQQ
ncbi:MAG: hypothetical protein AB7U82_34865 [Blastocatellales bacterium]